MTRTLTEVIKGLPLDQQQEIAAQATRLIEVKMTLRDLRKAHELMQKRMAEKLRISQDGVSRIEKRSDFLLSTLGCHIEAVGGKLRLMAEFPDRKPVTLPDIKSLDTHAGRDRKTTPSRAGGKRRGRPKKKPHSADVA